MLARKLMRRRVGSFATWNSSDKGAGITLSGSDLIATVSSAAMVRSTIGKSSGKWYWEVTRGAGSADSVIGIANSSAALTNYLGSDAHGKGYIGSNGNKLSNASSTAYGSSYTDGDVIGVALDMDAGTLVFYKNGVSQGTAFTGLSGTFYAAFGTTNAGDNVTANFGATAFTYTPPVGYNAGLFT